MSEETTVVKCAVCNKPLSDDESVKLGIGPLCRAKGWTKESVAARKAELHRDEVPEGWIKVAEVAERLRLEEIPVARMVRAFGGDRAMEPPVNEMFQVIYVGKSRYLPPESVSEAGLNLLRDKYLGETPPEKPVKVKKEPKPKKEKKAKAEADSGGAIDIQEVWNNG